MARHCFAFSGADTPEITYDPEILWINNKRNITLRRVDATGNYAFSPLGKYPVTGGIVTTGNIEASGLTSFYSFEEFSEIETDEDGNDLGEIRYQLSLDDGITWLYWTGVAWAAAGAGNWNTAAEIDDGITSADITHQYKFRAQLLPDVSLDYSPQLKEIMIGVVYRYNVLEDLVRTIKRYLDNNLSFDLTSLYEMPSTTNNFVLNVDFTISSIYGCYDITADPDKAANLYSSFNPATNTITMTGPVTAGHIIETEFVGRCSNFIARADEDLQISSIPSVYIFHNEGEDEKKWKESSNDTEITISRSTGRKGQQLIWRTVLFNIMCVAKYPNTVLAMNSSIDNLLSDEKSPKIYSLATGERCKLHEYILMTTDQERDVVGKMISFKLSAPRWTSTRTEAPLATTLDYDVSLTVPERA